MKKSSSESPISFLSLPYDVVVNILARILRIYYPILSLVSKSFRPLLALPDLEYARSRIGKPDKYLHVCLNLNNKPNPSWFILSSTTSPNQQRKLIQTPSFPYQHLNSSTVVSVGLETYVVGGGLVVNGRKRRSRRVFIIDCKSHQWRKLPKMLLARKEADVNVIDGKIYVVGGCSSRYYDTENYGEVYDPKTQTWEPTTQRVLTDEQVALRYLNYEQVAMRYLTDEHVEMRYLTDE